MSVYIGIDWSEKKHNVTFANHAGAVLTQSVIPHTVEGFEMLDATRRDIGVSVDDCVVGLETAHNLLIDFLWARNYSHIYVIHPHITKSSRGRYSHSGAYTDDSDSALLAEILRTDRQRLQPWYPDLPVTRHMSAKVSLLLFLTRNCVRFSNRLRAVLLRYYPLPLNVFKTLDAPLTLKFIRQFPSTQAAQALSFEEFQAFALQHRYSRPRKLPACYDTLQEPQLEPAPEIAVIYQEEAVSLAALLLSLVETKKRTQKELQVLFHQHPDWEIFDSLPGVGDLLAPALLVKFGDDRQRFPSAASVQALAGTCPVTKKSGKRKTVHFRYACDREFRYIAQHWAMQSVNQSAWASGYFRRVLPRCRSKSHAYRCLANRWLAIAWKLWHSREQYDETYHLQQVAQRRRPKNVIFVN